MLTPKLTLALACALLCTTALAQQIGTFTDTRDGKIYKTVKIGEQVWFAENLNYEASGSKCYNDSIAYCDKYGRLYNWETAMKACPKFWHLPTRKEWDILTATVGGEKTAGKYLKATSGWNWNDVKRKSGNGEDKFGFSALPSGFGNSSVFYPVGYYGYWWSANEYNSDGAYYRYMIYYDDGMGYRDYDKDYLCSVRCLQD